MGALYILYDWFQDLWRKFVAAPCPDCKGAGMKTDAHVQYSPFVRECVRCSLCRGTGKIE